MDKPDQLKLLTQCVHAGGYIDDEVGGVTTPIYTSSSYRFGEGHVCYPRYYNVPTQTAVASKIAALEHGEAALAVSSGMAAISTVLFTFLSAGDHAVIQRDIYGGAFHFTNELERLGVQVSLVKGDSVDDFAAHITEKTRLIYFETPTNPLLKIIDIAAMASLAKERGVISVIDNTFATPINQRPIELGIDVVVHSGTKYLGGHSDLCCGAIVSRTELVEKIGDVAVDHGVVLSAGECYQLERSLKTLGLRVRQQNANGLAVARFLNGHPKVNKTYYPGLDSHPGHDIAGRQMSGYGGMLSLELTGDKGAALRIVDRLKLFAHAVSLGGVESLVCFPSLTSHAKMSPSDRVAGGITDSLIRMSCGIEDSEDLIEDLTQALG